MLQFEEMTWPFSSPLFFPSPRRGGPVSFWEHLSTLADRYAEPFFRFAAFETPDPDYDWRTLDFDSDVSRLDWLRPILDAKNPDLRRFRDRGGKILMYYGGVDQSLNPLQSVDYYEELRGKMGPSTGDFFRLYMVPGMFHCGGGVGAHQFGRNDSLIDWVENGSPAQHLMGSRVVDGEVLTPVQFVPIRKWPAIRDREALMMRPTGLVLKLRSNPEGDPVVPRKVGSARGGSGLRAANLFGPQRLLPPC